MRLDLLALATLAALAWPAAARADAALDPDQKLVRDIFEELVEIDTSSTGSTSKAAVAMAKRLKMAGYPTADVQVLGPVPKKGNLVVRLRGSGKRKPLLLLAHLDVVDAHRDDWTLDPFTLTEKEGYYYGRGTTDDKAMAAMWMATMIRLKKERFVPNRDVILALTADEEGGEHNGVDWLIKNHRELIDAEYCLNEGGGGQMKDGKYIALEIQAAEKVYLSFVLETRNKGGHSSIPVKENAIVQLAGALVKIGAYDFPVMLSEITRGFFDRMSQVAPPAVAKDMKAVAKDKPDPNAVKRLASLNPIYNSLMRTTCVPTRLEGGHADNALPQMARAIVNCRLLPGAAPKDVQLTLEKVVGDANVSIKPKAEANPGPASPLLPEIVQAVEALTKTMFPGVPVVPSMSTGATDGLHLRRAGIPTYGVDGIFDDIDDIRAHGRDERIGVKQFFEGYTFGYKLTRALCGSP